MMMVGHTHEDIDAIFKLVVMLWRRLRRVLCPVEFAQMLKDAIPNAVVHAMVEYVHNWAGFFEDCIYTNMTGVTTAREFILRQRDDGGACHTRTRLAHATCVRRARTRLTRTRLARARA